MSKVDWSKAPEGATHWDPEYRNWLQQLDWISLVWLKGKGWSRPDNQYPSDLSSLQRLDAKPVKPAWTGEGLPPVGTVCEVKWMNSPLGEGSWGVAEILYSSKSAIVWRWQGVTAFEFGANAGEVKCRLIRTPEQIAAEEREKAIEALRADTDWILDHDCAQAVLAAGYRKVEGGAA